MTDTIADYKGIPLDQWTKREANCDRMDELCAFFDPATESAAWIVTGWGHSIVADSDVRDCREWLTCTASRGRLNRFHAMLTAEHLICSSSWHGDYVNFTPA